jgi:hypothetical protein
MLNLSVSNRLIFLFFGPGKIIDVSEDTQKKSTTYMKTLQCQLQISLCISYMLNLYVSNRLIFLFFGPGKIIDVSEDMRKKESTTYTKTLQCQLQISLSLHFLYVKSLCIKPIDFFVFRSWEDHRRFGRYEEEKIHNIYENTAVSASDLSLHFLYVKSLCIKPIDFFVFRSWEDHRRFGRYTEKKIHNIYDNTALSASNPSSVSHLHSYSLSLIYISSPFSPISTNTHTHTHTRVKSQLRLGPKIWRKL